MGQPKGTEVNCDIIPKILQNSKKIKYLCIQLLLNNTQYHTYLMLVLLTIMLIFMTATFTTWGVLLWHRRSETGDSSRFIQAIFSWFSTIFSFIFILRTRHETTTIGNALFEPEHTFVPLLFQITFFFYPLEVIRPSIKRTKLILWLITPLLILGCVGMCASIQYTPIHTYADLKTSIRPTWR